MQAANRENAASAVCARLPREDALAVLSQEAAALLALPEQEPAAAAPARPDCPQAFSGVDEERRLDKAQRDMREFDRLTAKKHRPSVPFWVLAALFAGLGAAGWFVRHEPLIPAAFALAALVCAVAALGNAAHDRRREAELSEAQALLTLYENHSRDEFYAYAVQYRDALRAWQAACEAASAQNAARDAESRLRAERTAALLGSVRMFAEAGTVREAQNAIASALAAYRAWHEAEQTAQQAKTRYDALAQALGEIPELPAPARDVSGLTTEQAQAALRGEAVPEPPPLCDRVDTALRQFRLAAQDKGEHIACLEARKHFAWYLRGVAHSGYYKEKISAISTMDEIERIADGIKRDLG